MCPQKLICSVSVVLSFWRDAETNAGSIMQLFGPQMPFISPFLLLQHLSNNMGPTTVSEEASLVHHILLCPSNLSRFTLPLFTVLSRVRLENMRSGQG